MCIYIYIDINGASFLALLRAQLVSRGWNLQVHGASLAVLYISQLRLSQDALVAYNYTNATEEPPNVTTAASVPGLETVSCKGLRPTRRPQQ